MTPSEWVERYKEGRDDCDKKWRDKIQAKIEELDKEEQELQNSISDEEREEYSDASISFDLMDLTIRKEILQELLEESD